MAPIADLQRKVLLTQPVTLFQQEYDPTGTLPLVDGSLTSWTSVGTDPWREDLYGREGLKISKAQEVMRYKGSRSLGDIAAVRTSDELMLDLTLYDASIEAMAFLLDQDVRETRAASATEGQIQRVGMSRPKTMREYSFIIRGSAVQDPDATEVRAGQFVVPRGRIISPYERNQSVAEWVKTPVQIVALVDYSQANELERLGWYEELGETT